MITYTFGEGGIPEEVESFMSNCGDLIVAVVGSGDVIWGEKRLWRASIDISEDFNVPLLHNFEKAGFATDVELVANKIMELERKI